MPRWFHGSAGGQVESFLVQASYPVEHLHQTRGQTLLRHLLSRFQTDSSAEEEQTGSRTLFACAAAGLPPVFVSVMLYPAYHPITIVPTYRPYWGQVGDEYLYVLYAFLAMGVAAIVLWDSIFPDLLDVFALGVLPLSPRLLLRARWQAAALIFGLVLLCVVAPGAVLLPAVAEENFLRQFLAHAISAGAAGLSTCALLLGLQAMLELVLGTRRAKQFMPILQTAALLAFFALLGNTPWLLNGLQRGAPDSRVPVIWFLAIYEQIRGGATLHPGWIALAWRGWLAIGLSLLAAALTYPRAYQRRMLFLVESGNAAAPGVRAPRWINRLLHRMLVQTPGSRATFHFVAQTVFRVSKLRTQLVIYVGLGLAVLLATSVHRPALAIAIVCCAVVLGCTTVIQSQILPRSAWMVHVLPRPKDEAHVLGSRTLVTLWAALSTILLLFLLAAGTHDRTAAFRGLLIALGAALALPSALSSVLLSRTHAFPFTGEQDATPEHFVLIFLRNMVAIPCGLLAFGWCAEKSSSSAVGVSLWLVSMGLLALATRPEAFQYVRHLRSSD